MDFSEEWKSVLPIGSVFGAPLLLSNPSSKAILGPLFFNPKPHTLSQLFASPSLFPPLLNPPPHLSLPRFLSTSTITDSPIPLSTASSIASFFGPQYPNFPSSSLLLHNRLQLLKCPRDGSHVVFFSTGCNHDQIGFLLLRVKDKSLVAVGDQNNEVYVDKKRLGQQIVRILVNPVEDSACFDGNSANCSNIFGYLLVYTMYSVHWFCVKISEMSKRPVLDYRGCKMFKTGSVVGACWSPHLPEESVVLLESGTLFLFDLASDSSSAYFRGTRLKVSWDDSGGPGKCKWLGCEFSWHPRILILARSDAVFMVDWRYGDFNVTCLANIDMFGVYASVERERFLALSRAVSDNFHFVLVSDSMLVLCDVRKPLMPALQWAHGVDKPCYVDVFSLSELRANWRDATHKWATVSGFGIILGSFWNCEFSLFCYGPSLPSPYGSIASKISEISKSVYAWELPSDFLLSGNECWCGSCLVREEFWKDALPEWTDWQQKKDIVLGFVILPNDLSSLLFEPDEFGGFTLIRLMSSGKLESQRYCASWDLIRKSEVTHRDPLLCFEDNLLYSTHDEEYKFPREFQYLSLGYLCAYLDGDLSYILDSNMKKPCNGPRDKEYFSLDIHEILCQKLKICGFSRFRTSPAISIVFNDINLPTSIYEVALRRIWAGLPVELLQLAFSYCSEFLEVHFNQKKVNLEFLVVPDVPQLPPIFLRKPSSCNSRWLYNGKCSDALVGPVLPLPVLITLHEFRYGCPNSEEEIDGFSPEVELTNRCNEVLQVAKEMAMSNSTSKLHDDDAISLADDNDEPRAGFDKQKSFFVYHPMAFQHSTGEYKEGDCVYKDDRLSSLITKVHVKQNFCGESVQNVGQEVFDDLCLTDLKFDTHVMNFGSQELKVYNLLKKHLSKWQEEFTPCQEFCSQFTSQNAG